MLKSFCASAAVAAALAGLVAIAPAFAAGPLEITTQVLTETKQRATDGTTQVALVPVRRAVPGDRVVFALTWRNTGAQPLGNVVLVNPVPGAIAYRAPGAGSPAPDVSVNGREFGPLAALRVALPAGGTRAATADDVTHVRWRLATPLAAGAAGRLAFQAVLK